MNKLLHAILDNDEKLVREVIEKKPSLILREGYSGRNALQVAKASGNVLCLVPMLRKCSSYKYSNDSYRDLLVECISYISDQYFCAQWEDNIEKRLWHVLYNNCEDPILKLDLDTISDIRWLASQAQAWPVYKDNFIDWVSLDSANFSC